MSWHDILSSIPVPTRADFVSDTCLEVQYSVIDNERDVKNTTSKTFILSGTGSKDVAYTSSQLVDSTIVLSAWSPSKRFRAVLRQVDQAKRVVEVWGKDGTLVISKDVTEKHGEFYKDDNLSTLSFSPADDLLVYVAEALPPKTKEKFEYFPSLGETLTNRRRPLAFSLCITQPEKKVMPIHIPQDSSSPHVYFGQHVFAPDGKTLFATGYERTRDDRILGLVWCFNRPSAIFQINLGHNSEFNPGGGDAIDATATRLTPSNLCCRSPRVSPSGQLVFLSNALGGAHAGSTSLHSIPLPLPVPGALNASMRTVVGPVWEPATEKDSFPGLFLGPCLSESPFIDEGKRVVVQTMVGSRSMIAVVDLVGDMEQSNAVNVIRDIGRGDGDLEDISSYTLLCTNGESKIVVVRSSLISAPEIRIWDGDVWTLLEGVVVPEKVSSALSKMKLDICKIPDRHPVETIVLRSAEKKPSPMVLMPHGGPHGTTPTGWWPATTAMALEGYTLSLPNYTGSLGFGERYVQALLGECGTLDVTDCIASVRHLVKLGLAEEGEGKLFVWGGSHGGFLTGHLIGQYPTTFSGAAIRNPVISAGDFSGSDIPDWYFAEFGLPFIDSKDAPPYTLSAEHYAKLQAASPIAHVDKVVTPVLLLIGSADNRVNPKQGLGYYHALKGSEKIVKLMWFEGEGHPLDGVEAARVSWEAARDWFGGNK